MPIERKVSKGKGMLVDSSATEMEEPAAQAEKLEAAGSDNLVTNSYSVSNQENAEIPPSKAEIAEREAVCADGNDKGPTTSRESRKDGKEVEGGQGAGSGPNSATLDASGAGRGDDTPGSTDQASPSTSPYVVQEVGVSETAAGGDASDDKVAKATANEANSPSINSPSEVVDEEADKKFKSRRLRSRRLSFADELGGQLSDVSYHTNLHYAQVDEPARPIRSKDPDAGCECVCVIS